MASVFEFASAGRIRFGRGVVSQLPALLAEMSQFVLLVTGRDATRHGAVMRSLKERNLSLTSVTVAGEPSTDTVREALATARQAGVGAVVAIGGGSAIDVGKAVSALLTNRDELTDYLEVIGRGRPLERPAAPFVAVPTTAGSGSEVTRNAVMLAPGQRVKVSLRSHFMLPRLALVDPELTRSLPPGLTAACGLDALTQLIEPFVSVGANPLCDALCREGIGRVARSLARAFANGADQEARDDMSLASLFGGLALANAKLGAVHGLAGPIGGLFPSAPHGLICGRLLAAVMEINIRALKERYPDSPALDRFRELARLLTGDPEARAVDGIIRVQDLCRLLALPPLSDFGLGEEAFDELVRMARRSSSMQGNPIKLSAEELVTVLGKAVMEG